MRWIAITLLLASSVATAEAADEKGRIQTGATAVATALMAGDHAAFVTLTYPKVVALIGGRERFIEVMRSGREDMQSHGSDFIGFDIQDVGTPVKAGTEKHAIVRYSLRVKVQGGTVFSDTYLLAISGDDGASWTYVDGAGLTPDMKQALFPDFNDALTLPALAQPRFAPE